jgi:2-(1,2-epoxy-1,2-dihydrophenyl)acetyl-CoA isomerase
MGTMTSSVQRRGRVLRCVISSAEHGSALSDEAVREATEALRNAGPEVGAVLLAGEGPNFCTGGDVRAFAAAADPGALVTARAGEFHAFQRAIADAPVPVIAAVHGWAAGAGLSIVCLADIAVAGTSTRLRPAYPGIGFSPDGGMSWTLPRSVGAARARYILLTNQVLDAGQALALGLVSVVVPDEEITAEAERVAAQIADGPTAALGRIKRLIRDGASAEFGAHLDAEAGQIAASASGAEGREGLRAFAERRPPRFHDEPAVPAASAPRE